MRDSIHIGNVGLVAATPEDVKRGLLGWVSCTLNGSLRVDGLALRRTFDGRLTLSFPARRDGQGRQHPYFRPLGDRARRGIEHQVFRALGLLESADR